MHIVKRQGEKNLEIRYSYPLRLLQKVITEFLKNQIFFTFACCLYLKTISKNNALGEMGDKCNPVGWTGPSNLFSPRAMTRMITHRTP